MYPVLRSLDPSILNTQMINTQRISLHIKPVPIAIPLYMALLSIAGNLWAQTAPSSAMEQRDGRWYERGADAPFTGDVEDAGEMAGRIEDGFRAGRWMGWHENGEVAWTTDYENGQQTRHEMFYANGQKRFEGSFSDGAPDGITRMWSENGVLTRETHYSAGQRNGSHTLWDEEGRLFLTEVYENGVLHGASTWWFENGQKRWEISYAKGKRNGVWTQWGRDGDLFMQSEWKDGELVTRNNPHAHH